MAPSTLLSIIKCILNAVIGITLGLTFAALFGYYTHSLHDLRLWFSQIDQVEREISFRTESGLYYSFYKHLVEDGEGGKGGVENKLLLRDRLTEWPREINALQRFNIYQEVSLANIYNQLSSVPLPIELPDPTLFYIEACFAFTGFLALSIYLLSWNLPSPSSDWITASLATAWLFANLEDSTRAHFTVNLRENFALPALWAQNLFVTRMLEAKGHWLWRAVDAVFIAVLTFYFSLLWQFNQFLLAVQSISLLGVLLLQQEKKFRVILALLAQSLGFAMVIPAQYYQPMLLSSVNLSLNFGILATLVVLSPKTAKRKIIFGALTAVLAVSAHLFLKQTFNPTVADSHIWSFLANKLHRLSPFTVEFLHLGGEVSFESALYLCHEAFSALDWSFWDRTYRTGLLPLYVVSLATAGWAIWKSSPNSAVVYLSIQSMFAGLLAAMSMRMKYVWLPLMAVLAAHSLSVMDRWIGKWGRRGLALALATGLLYGRYLEYEKEMANEQEFYDPDTVELMKWISTLPKSASFTGSMQLMAGVRACTLHPILNHPHFEDEWLRQRTQRLYQIYARRPIEEVHAILTNERAGYVILEDSICLAPSTGCTTNDIMDYTNGQETESGTTRFPLKAQPVKSATERFCNAVRQFGRDSKQFFRLMLENRTFRVYKVID